MAKNTICLWYDKDAEAAARFYAETFPDSTVGAMHRAPGDYPAGSAGGRERGAQGRLVRARQGQDPGVCGRVGRQTQELEADCVWQVLDDRLV